MKHTVATLTGDFSSNLKTHQFMLDACKLSGLTTLNTVKHEFYPQGLSAVVILAESHMSIHTYPEYRTAYIDCFTCNPNNDPSSAIIMFKELMVDCEIKVMECYERKI